MSGKRFDITALGQLLIAAVKKEIAEYQERADYFIKPGSQSPAVMER